MTYQANGTVISFHHREGDVDLRARCDQAQKAAELLNRAGRVNSKGHYTQAARLIAQAECLPGFQWDDGIEVQS